MEVQRIRTADVAESTSQPWSNCLKAGPFVFLSGLTASTSDGGVIGDDVETQSREVMRKLGALLESAGASFNDVVRLVIYLTDIDAKDDFATVRSQIFDQADPPCSTLLEVSGLVDSRLLVEVEATAIISHEASW